MKSKSNYYFMLLFFGLAGIFAAIGTGAAGYYSADQSGFIGGLTLILWPTCVIARSIQSGAEYGLYALSVGANALLYMALGGFVLLGIKRHRAFLLVPVLSLAVIWWQMFATYGNLLAASSSDVPLY